jgi:hypothetical protein
MRLTAGQLVVAVEAAAGSTVAAGAGLGVALANDALLGAGAPAWAAALVWAPPAGALGCVARRFHVLDEVKRWHGAAVRRVEALAEGDDEDESDDDQNDAAGVDDEVVDDSRG